MIVINTIKKLSKQKNKIQETENVDLGYESEIDLEIETLEAKLEDIKKKENQENLERESKKNSRRLNEDNVNIQQNINYQIDNYSDSFAFMDDYSYHYVSKEMAENWKEGEFFNPKEIRYQAEKNPGYYYLNAFIYSIFGSNL